MKNLHHRLLLVIAGATQKDLATYVRYLKTENQTLRSKLPKRVVVTEQERAKLVKFGSQLGGALNELVTIVHPNTLRRWIRESKKAKKSAETPAKKGRPRTKEEIRELIVKLGRENAWGYTRILGELHKLGVQAVSRNTVKNILKEHGLESGPQRGAGTWDEFLKVHAATLWQCDFYAKKVLTIKGWLSATAPAASVCLTSLRERSTWVATPASATGKALVHLTSAVAVLALSTHLVRSVNSAWVLKRTASP